jgi:hypothetical protein
LVARFFYDLQVPHLHAAHCEVGDLKLELDGYMTVLLALLGLNRRESETFPSL